MRFIVIGTFLVMRRLVEAGKYRPSETLFVLVADVDDAVLVLQPFRGWDVGTAV